jgi:hypothetical protein
MSDDKKIKISTGTEVEFKVEEPKKLYEIIIEEVLIPQYKENADWSLTLKIVIDEMNRLIKYCDLPTDYKMGLLNEIEDHLDKEISELTGVAKIEILFLDMDDYVEDIKMIITSNFSQEEERLNMANLIKPLTTFELVELYIYLGKRAFKQS